MITLPSLEVPSDRAIGQLITRNTDPTVFSGAHFMMKRLHDMCWREMEPYKTRTSYGNAIEITNSLARHMSPGYQIFSAPDPYPEYKLFVFQDGSLLIAHEGVDENLAPTLEIIPEIFFLSFEELSRNHKTISLRFEFQEDACKFHRLGAIFDSDHGIGWVDLMDPSISEVNGVCDDAAISSLIETLFADARAIADLFDDYPMVSADPTRKDCIISTWQAVESFKTDDIEQALQLYLHGYMLANPDFKLHDTVFSFVCAGRNIDMTGKCHGCISVPITRENFEMTSELREFLDHPDFPVPPEHQVSVRTPSHYNRYARSPQTRKPDAQNSIVLMSLKQDASAHYKMQARAFRRRFYTPRAA